MKNNEDNKLVNAALRYLRECVHFKDETGLPSEKANEILSAIIVNRWLSENNYKWKIEISKKPRGIDGTIVGDMTGEIDVEFKSSTQKYSNFQFKPDFNFQSHGCIIMTQILNGVPNRVFIAFGKKAINDINMMAIEDMKRPNFNFKRPDMALVHMTERRKGKQRNNRIPGLIDRISTISSPGSVDRDDQLIMIENPQLAEFLK
jgi:hypothetical protein